MRLGLAVGGDAVPLGARLAGLGVAFFKYGTPAPQPSTAQCNTPHVGFLRDCSIDAAHGHEYVLPVK